MKFAPLGLKSVRFMLDRKIKQDKENSQGIGAQHNKNTQLISLIADLSIKTNPILCP